MLSEFFLWEYWWAGSNRFRLYRREHFMAILTRVALASLVRLILSSVQRRSMIFEISSYLNGSVKIIKAL